MNGSRMYGYVSPTKIRNSKIERNVGDVPAPERLLDPPCGGACAANQRLSPLVLIEPIKLQGVRAYVSVISFTLSAHLCFSPSIYVTRATEAQCFVLYRAVKFDTMMFKHIINIFVSTPGEIDKNPFDGGTLRS